MYASEMLVTELTIDICTIHERFCNKVTAEYLSDVPVLSGLFCGLLLCIGTRIARVSQISLVLLNLSSFVIYGILIEVTSACRNVTTIFRKASQMQQSLVKYET